MKMRKGLLLHVYTYSILTCCILLFRSAFCQNDVGYNVVSVPPSPNASALAKFGEVPVDKSTGIPTISIPIFNYEDRGINLPISLTYHAGGIKVQEEASWVGLGWALEAGGVITRVMRGIPDEFGSGFLSNAEKVPNSSLIETELETPSLRLDTYNKLDQVSKGYLDFEPDAFYFNVNGASGSFQFGNHKLPVLIPFQDFDVHTYYWDGAIIGFRLIDPNGLIYYFGDELPTGDYSEQTHVQVRGPDPLPYTSAWYLRKIVNPFTKSEVAFHYTSYSYTTQNLFSYTELFERNNFGIWNSINQVEENINYTSIENAKFLNEIGLPGGKINFLTSATGTKGYRKLDEIKIYDSVSLSTRNYTMSYSLFQPDSRLKLLSLTETATNGIDSKVHTFEYESQSLPLYNSKSIDHWGFYNGKSNTTLLPVVTYAGTSFGSADRNPNETYAKACMLKKINYPTGGYTEFTFKGNTNGRLPTIEEISFPLSDPANGNPWYNVTGTGLHDEFCKSQALFFNPQYEYINFFIKAELSVNGTYDPTHHKGKVKIVNDANVTLFETIVTLNNPINIPINIPTITDGCSLIICANGAVTTLICQLTYSAYDPALLSVVKEFPAGGLRIEKLSNYDPLSNKTSYRTYEYGTNGYLINQLPPYYTLTKDKRMDGAQPYIFDRLMLFSSPVAGLGSSPNSVAYEKVTEYLGTNQLNTGKIITTFIKEEDLITGNAPYTPGKSNQWLRSKVKKEESYEFVDAASYIPRKTIIYDYEIDTNHYYSIKGFKASRIMSNNTTYIDYPDEFAIANYENWTYNYRLKHQSVTDQNNGQDVITDINYFYENPLHLNATRIEESTSDNRVKTKIIKYPLDLVTCQNTCEKAYVNSVDQCLSTIGSYSAELTNCISIYGNCYLSFLNDYKLRDIRLANECNFYGGLNIPCAMRVEKEMHIFENFDNCLVASGYYACLSQAQCNYTPCIVEANNTYLQCQENFNTCLLDNYNNTQDPNTKAIYLLALNHKNNVPIEQITKIGSLETEHLKWNYKEINVNAVYLPMPASVEREVGQGFEQEISFDQYDYSYRNIIRTTSKGVGLQTSYTWGYKGMKLIAETMNATNVECDYTGFENHEALGWSTSGNWSIVDETGNFKTGKSAAKVTGTGPVKGFNVQSLAGIHNGYKASVWVKGGVDAYLKIQVNEDGAIYKQVFNPNTSLDGWNLIEVNLPYTLYKNTNLSTMKIKVYCGSTNTAYFDDLRFLPMDAQMTTYTYDPLIGVTSVSDVNNKPTKYEYDGFGRLALVRDFKGNILKKYNYNYKH
jgi:YD repeat-containing protein